MYFFTQFYILLPNIKICQITKMHYMENITLQNSTLSKTQVILGIICGLVCTLIGVYELFSKQLLPSSYNISDNYSEDAMIRLLLGLSITSGVVSMSSIQIRTSMKNIITNFAFLCLIGFLLALLYAGVKL